MMQLRAVELMLADLPEVAAEWEMLPLDERIAWSLDWGNEMAGLWHMAQPSCAQIMDAAQHQRYEAILARLAIHTPTLDRLGLRRMPVPPSPDDQRSS